MLSKALLANYVVGSVHYPSWHSNLINLLVGYCFGELGYLLDRGPPRYSNSVVDFVALFSYNAKR